jgi:hypothetical protein
LANGRYGHRSSSQFLLLPTANIFNYYRHHHHILVITFVQGIYNYVNKTTPVSRAHSVAAVLYLQSVLHVMLFRRRNMFCTFTSTLSPVCKQLPICFFCSSLILCFPGMLLRVLWVIMKWFQSPPLLQVSLFLSHSTCAQFLLCLYIFMYYYYNYYYHHHVKKK